VRSLTCLFGLLAVFVLLSASAAAGELEIRFLDVGQGDAVLVRNGDKTALIDTGPTDQIVEQLRSLGVESLDLLLISHNHMDHVGGADALLAGMPVHSYLDNGWPAKTKIQEVILKLVDAKKIPYLEATKRDISLGDAVLHILPPGTFGEQNDRSVGVIIERGKFKAAFPGDAEVDELNGWVAAGLVPAVNVLKAAHHGSRNGVSPLWINATRPDLVVISCGRGNDYGHPHEAALRYYKTGGRKILRTDEVGSIAVRVQPDGVYDVQTGTQIRAHASGAGSPPARAESAAPVTKVPDKEGPSAACCRVCKSGRACGDICIPKEHSCSKPKGCACDG
jgi:competence protein ComEC